MKIMTALFFCLVLSGCGIYSRYSDFPPVDITVEKRAFVLMDNYKAQKILVRYGFAEALSLGVPSMPDARDAVRSYFKKVGRKCIPVDGSLMESAYYEFTYQCIK